MLFCVCSLFHCVQYKNMHLRQHICILSYFQVVSGMAVILLSCNVDCPNSKFGHCKLRPIIHQRRAILLHIQVHPTDSANGLCQNK